MSFAPVLTPAPPALRRLQVVLFRAGWEVRNLEIDVIANRAVVELHRNDGRYLHLVVDSLGRASLSRFDRGHETVKAYGLPCVRIKDEFLGRQSRQGARAGLRLLCRYVADNPAPDRPALTAGDVRRALAPLMIPWKG